MILIFGGTTEGRLAIDVCEEAGKPFYYSTKGTLQQVELHNGIRLTGALTADDICAFCKQKKIACIVDAAHPFAQNLHATLAQVGIPTIRLQRLEGERMEGVCYCTDYDDAIAKMEAAGIKRLLALSGANTVGKLKPFWTKHPTLFRILERDESLETVRSTGFPMKNIIFYPEHMPSFEQEKRMIKASGCDAIITKNSGQTGGFETKAKAAMELGITVFALEAPPLPPTQARRIIATGKHTLRRAIEELTPGFFPLRTGLTTGACATAATKAALLSLLTDELPEEVSFALPDEEVLTIRVACSEPGCASVIKDYSDDPDVLKGCKITSQVARNSSGKIRFLRGEGVGVVTLPGLGIEVGEAAINPTPRKMITDEIRALSSEGFDVSISVENGEELARSTFNYKVGVMGGISIIGTSGIVSPLSNEAFIRSIGRELEVARAIGCKEIGFASGKKGEEALKEKEPDLRVIHYGNFIGKALEKAHTLGFERVVLGILIGKALKLSEGHLDTHSHKVSANLDKYGVKMARDLWNIKPPAFFEEITQKCLTHCRKVFPDGKLEVRLIRDKNI